jgi:Protein of unknown function (DUF3106)
VLRLKAMTKWMGAGTLALALIASSAFAAQGNRAPRYQGRAPQGHHAGQWLNEHRNLPPEQQRRALESDPGFRRLPPQRQEQLRNQLQRFNHMTPEQQNRTLNRMETWEHLTPEQKVQARGIYHQWQQLPPDRRQAVKGALQTLRAMPPDARQRAIDSDDYKRRFSPQERNMLDGASRLPLAPPEPNEHAPEE